MAKDFKFTVNEDSARAADFMEVFGRLTVCVRSPLPMEVHLADHGPDVVYMLDMSEITWEEHERLVKFLAGKFSATVEEAEAVLAEQGLPILASEGMMTIENPQRWVMDDVYFSDDYSDEEIADYYYGDLRGDDDDDVCPDAQHPVCKKEGHNWEELWRDDVGISCRVCLVCMEEKIFEAED